MKLSLQAVQFTQKYYEYDIKSIKFVSFLTLVTVKKSMNK